MNEFIIKNGFISKGDSIVDGSLSATTFYGDGSNLTGISGSTDTYSTGGTYSDITDSITITNSSGGTFSITGVSDTFITGMTFNPSNYQITSKRNDGFSTTPIDLSILSSDVNITGGTYDIDTGIVEFTNNTGGTFNVTGFVSGMTDTYTNAANLSGNSITFDRNIGGVNVYNVDLLPLLSGKTDVSLFNGYTATTETLINNKVNISLFDTYTGDTETTLLTKVGNGGNVGSGSGEIFRDKTGTTLNFRTLSGGTNTTVITIGDINRIDVSVPTDLNTFVTGFTYNDLNTFTISDNLNTAFTATINQMSGLTVNGTLSATTISATTVYVNGTGNGFVTIDSKSGQELKVFDRGNNLNYVEPNVWVGSETLGATLNVGGFGSVGSYHTGTFPGLHLRTKNGKIYLFNDTYGGTGVDVDFMSGTISNIQSITSSDNVPLKLYGGPGPNDANDGIQMYTADNLNVHTLKFEIKADTGTPDAYFTNINNFGINTTAPITTLDVSGTTRVLGLTANTLNLVTPPTVNNSGTQILVRDTTSGNVDYRDASTLSGDSNTNTFVTGYTYNDANAFTIYNNLGSAFTASINIMTGLTVNGSLSATTFYEGGSNIDTLYTSFSYVDNLSLGLEWQLPAQIINLIGNTSTPLTGSSFNNCYIIDTGGDTGPWSGFTAGDLIQYQSVSGGTWVNLGATQIGDSYGITFETTDSPIGDFIGEGNYLVEISGGTSGAWTYIHKPPVNNWAIYVDNQIAFYRNISYTYTSELLQWVKLAGNIDYTFGDGLTVDGNNVESTYTDNLTYSNDILTLSRTQGKSDLSVSIDNFYVTGQTFNPSTYDLTLNRSGGLTDITSNLSSLASDIYVTGGTVTTGNTLELIRSDSTVVSVDLAETPVNNDTKIFAWYNMIT